MSGHRAVASTDAPAAIGPYSPGIQAGQFLFLSGQIPLDPATGALVPGDITVQTERVMANIAALLAAALLVDARLWSADRPFIAAARNLEVAFTD